MCDIALCQPNSLHEHVYNNNNNMSNMESNASNSKQQAEKTTFVQTLKKTEIFHK